MTDTKDKWWRHKENILLVVSISIVLIELINAEILGRHFHAEFLVFAGALCGAWATQLGDRK
jgi:hypothetical protein